MLWKKKDKISMELWPKGSGWEYVYLTVNGERYKFVISTVFDYGFNALLEGLYYLNPDVHQYDSHTSDFCPHRHIFDYVFSVGEIRGTRSYIVENMEEARRKMGRDYGFGVEDIPYKLEFSWMDEPGSTNWLIEKPKNNKRVFDLHIHIINNNRGEEEKIIDFTVPYKEFCYVVAKAATEVLKKHGLLGYHTSVFNEDMNLRCLLRLKAYALGCEQDIKVTRYTDAEGDISSLEAEFKLLMRDM